MNVFQGRKWLGALVVVLMLGAGTLHAAWQSYNDLAWQTGQTNYRITRLSFIDDTDHDLSGGLIRYDTGVTNGVTVTFSVPITGSFSTVSAPTSGSPADLIFNGKVDMSRTVNFLASQTGTITITGLTPSERYKIVLLGNRGEVTYTTRKTTLTLGGASSFVNSSSAGAVLAGLSNETTTITTGTNTGGLVFQYSEIDPGSDGQLQFQVTGDQFSLYLNSMMVEELPAAVPAWTSYNDIAWSGSQTNYRITHYSFVDDASHDLGGELLRHGDGLGSGVTMTFAGGAGAGFSSFGVPNAGSPAALTFSGRVDVTSNVFLPSGVSGTITLSGLSDTRQYEITLFGNRSEPTYTERKTVITLSGADSFMNASSAGAVVSNETTVITTGTNMGGQLFIYTDVVPGGDGQVVLTMSGNAGYASYINAIKVELLSEDPGPPAIANGSATIGGPTTATLGGSLTSTGVLPTGVWLYWKTVSDGGTNKVAWTDSLALGYRSAGALSQVVSNLLTNTTYYYRYYASNALGETWATPAASFTMPGLVITSSVPFSGANRRQTFASNRRGGLIISEIMYAPFGSYGDEGEFIEIYNTLSYAEDLGGWRISGEIDYAFTNGASIPARSFLVIARNPTWLEGAYQISGVLGPYSNKMSNGGGMLRIRDDQDSILYETTYDDDRPWPLSAAGAGHSLVLTKPDYGEGDVRAWEASAVMWGNPGRSNQTISSSYSLQHLRINELLTHTDPPQEDFVELFNSSTGSINLAGCWLTDNPSQYKYQIVSGSLGPTACVAYTQTQLGFGLSRQGGEFYILNPAADMIIDAVSYEAQENGVSIGRLPDGAPGLHELTAVTTGRVNRTTSLKIRDVVINEIMYNPPTGDSGDEFVELYNRGAAPMNIGYWRFISGVEYMFPAGTVIPTNGYFIVTRDRAQFLGKHTNVNPSIVFGDYSGSLSDRGERLAFAKPDDVNFPYQDFVVIDEVEYSDGWTEESDGNGSSLELRDPRSDNRLAASWADSDESQKAPWTTIETTVNLDDEDYPVTAGWPTDATDYWWGPSLVPYYLRQIQVFLNGQGECLIDELHVTRGGTEFVQNPSLDANAANWVIGHRTGTHKESLWISSGGSNNTGCIQVKSSRGGAPGINCIAATLNSGIATNDVGIKLTLKARWLKGNPSLQARIVGNGLWADGQLVLPDNLGTPGAQNSRYAANVGPDISDMFYTPVLPPAGSNVTVTARLQDIDGLQGADIKWRLDPNSSYNTTNMNDSGLNGDAVPNDGTWSGRIPGQATTNVVCFYISARDNNGSMVRVYPDMAPTQEVFIIFGVTNGAVGDYGVMRFIVPPSRDRDTTQGSYWGWERMDNAFWDVTLLYNDSRIIPNAGTRFAGSPETRPKPGVDMPIYDGESTFPANFREANQSHAMKIPKENRLCGSTTFNLQNLNNQNRARPLFSPGDPTFVAEEAMSWIAREIGLKTTRQRYIHLFGNDYHKGIVFGDQMAPEDEFIETYLPDSTDGETYDLKGSPGENAKTATAANYYGQTNNAFGRGHSGPVIGVYRHDDGTIRQEMYRLVWDKKITQPRDTDVSALVNVALAIDRPVDGSAASQKSYLLGLDKVVDWEVWARTMAFRKCMGDTDAWGSDGPKNMYMHIPKNGKAILLNWGYDSGFGVAGYSQTDDNRSDLPPTGLFCPWNSSITMCTDSTLSNSFLKCYAVRRALWRGVNDVLAGPMSPSQLNPQLDKLFNAHSNNNIQAWKNMKPGANDALVMTAAELAEVKAWPATRRTFILTNGEFYASLTSTIFSASASGTTTARVFQISGNAPVQAKILKVNGVAMRDIDVTWTSELAYALDMPAQTNGAMSYVVSAWDNRGVQVGTNQTLSVNYSGTISSPSGQVVISEIMYDPAASGGGYIELFNSHASEAFDLAGLRLNGADIVFPVGTVIGPQQYKVAVASEPAFFGAYSTNPTLVLGEYAGTLDNGGETISLETPLGLTNIVVTNLGVVVTNVYTNYAVIDTVTYDDDAPWPSEVRGGGQSLQLIDPTRDNDRLANWTCAQRWRQVTMTGTGTTTTLYLYLNGGSLGPVLLDDMMLVTGVVAEVGSNLLVNGSFEDAFPGAWNVATPYAESIVEGNLGRDGGSVLLMEASSTDTTGIRQYGVPVVSGQVYTLSYWYLPLSTGGTFTVRFSGSWVSSAPSLAMSAGGATPGRTNTLAGSLNVIPRLWINELMPANTGTPQDNMTESEPWLELYNSDGVVTNLTAASLYLTDDYDSLTRWAFPNNPNLSSGARRLVWLDGETNETVSTNHLHTSFRASSTTGHLALVQINNGRTTIVDYVNYVMVTTNKSYGVHPEARTGDWSFIIFDSPSPLAANNPASQTNLPLVLNEWCAANNNILADPADGQFEDWVEVYNPNGVAVDLSGWMITDNLEEPNKCVLSSGRSIPPLGYLLVWADNEPGQETAATAPHAGFSLSANGETLGLFRPDGTLVDYKVFSAQEDNITGGRYPDGDDEIFEMAVPTPGSTNKLFQATTMVSTGGVVHIVWNVRPSTQYRLYYADTVRSTNWIVVGPDLQTNASMIQVDLSMPVGARYYKLVMP